MRDFLVNPFSRFDFLLIVAPNEFLSCGLGHAVVQSDSLVHRSDQLTSEAVPPPSGSASGCPPSYPSHVSYTSGPQVPVCSFERLSAVFLSSRNMPPQFVLFPQSPHLIVCVLGLPLRIPISFSSHFDVHTLQLAFSCFHSLAGFSVRSYRSSEAAARFLHERSLMRLLIRGFPCGEDQTEY